MSTQNVHQYMPLEASPANGPTPRKMRVHGFALVRSYQTSVLVTNPANVNIYDDIVNAVGPVSFDIKPSDMRFTADDRVDLVQQGLRPVTQVELAGPCQAPLGEGWSI